MQAPHRRLTWRAGVVWALEFVRVPYAQGTLVIDLRDPATRSFVWRAIATDEEIAGAQIESARLGS
jgi:hypothetical protein